MLLLRLFLDSDGFFNMESQIESILVYGVVAILCLAVVIIYLRKQKRESKSVEEKIEKAKQEGIFEPVSLHPVVDVNTCIKSGACIVACPEKDILGIRNGKATTINASHCIGHGACFHACPTQAITLVIGTEKRGIDLPHINQNFETNVPGIFIAGELGGMGLIKNAVVQGMEAVENIVKQAKKDHTATYDLIIIGAGPAGISASLTAKKHDLRFITLEQDTLGGTVFSFPRSKIVMTSAMELPLYGKVKLFETSKSELLDLWKEVLRKNDIAIKENSKVEAILHENGHFLVETLDGEKFTAKHVLLSIGRRGTPRKLGVPGETLEKVAYRLLEPEDIKEKHIIVVGGGDSAVESALLLADQNKVTLAYRAEVFNRLKPKNNKKINDAMSEGLIDVRFNTNIVNIGKDEVTLAGGNENDNLKIKNDLVYIFAGGELPTQFLEKVGLQITKKFGEAILKH
jgi:thioredoxin reductase (NADPH)